MTNIGKLQSSAGKQTQDIAAASPWSGTESIHDSSLRMLNDASKPMRVPFKPPQPGPGPVDLRPSPKSRKTSGQRLASARDRTSAYTLSQDSSLSEKERDSLRKEFQERFSPGARPMPASVQGLSSLANELIEDAMAQGKFKNIRRGKGIGAAGDQATNNPFLDTTENIMNRLVQRQEVVPPWIEKQQELAREVGKFRNRLRNDWGRHAARLVASQGGSLQAQIRRARAYAIAEASLSQTRTNKSQLETENGPEEWKTQINQDGRLSGVTSDTSSSSSVAAACNFSQHDQENMSYTTQNSDTTSTSATELSREPLPDLPPLRDPEYLSAERRFHELSIKTLNTLTRSYNLLAPQAAHKPYLNLERELASCYADVAACLPDEIHKRVMEKGRGTTYAFSKQGIQGGILDKLAPKQDIRLHEEDVSKRYGLKEFWRDLWGRGQK